jgi:membrane-bound lytic murein transglycosylase B
VREPFYDGSVKAFAALLGASLCVTSLSTAAQQAPPQQPPQQPVVQSFDEFVAGLRAEALAKGISQATIDATLTNVEPLPVAVERDRTQPETVVSLDTYVTRHLTPKVLATAREMAVTHARVLREVNAKYGVPPNMLIAVWGVESNFGIFTGTRPTVPALVTLAYDGRRPLFRSELFKALEIVDAGHITVDQLNGSWAGAMGQPQFMPSSYLKYAVDFDHDGRADIWTSQADVFGSIANYLKEYGWVAGGRWGREVRLTKAARAKIDHSVAMRTGNCRAEREMTVAKPVSDWKRLGVTLLGGKPLPKGDPPASLVRGDKRAFLVFHNYNAILGYNCSNSYAVSIGLIADKVGTAKK